MWIPSHRVDLNRSALGPMLEWKIESEIHSKYLEIFIFTEGTLK